MADSDTPALGAPRRRPGRPATGHDPTRSVRIGDVWDEAMKVSRRRGETLHQVITRALEDYVKECTDGNRT